MSCRGVHFAIVDSDVNRLKKARSNDEVIEIVQDEIEEKWDREWLCETDKAWDAIHRCLTGGGLSTEPEPFPLALCVLGGKQIYSPEGDPKEGQDYFVCLVEAEDVPKVAAAIGQVGREEMRRRYFALDPDQCDGPMGEEDWEYTWDNFVDVQEFFTKAAKAARAIIFTVDQ